MASLAMRGPPLVHQHPPPLRVWGSQQEGAAPRLAAVLHSIMARRCVRQPLRCFFLAGTDLWVHRQDVNHLCLHTRLSDTLGQRLAQAVRVAIVARVQHSHLRGSGQCVNKVSETCQAYCKYGTPPIHVQHNHAAHRQNFLVSAAVTADHTTAG